MSGSNTNFTPESHSSVTKTRSNNAGVDGGSSSRLANTDGDNGRSPIAVVRSTSSAMAEGVRDVRLIGNGYRRSLDFFTRPEPSGTDASMASIDRAKTDAQERPTNAGAATGSSGSGSTGGGGEGKGKAPMTTPRARPYENGIHSSGHVALATMKDVGALADGIQKSYIDRRSPNGDEHGQSEGSGSAIRHSNSDKAVESYRRRASVGEEQGVGGSLANAHHHPSNMVTSNINNGGGSAASDARNSRALVAPYHVSGTQSPVALAHQSSAPGLPMVRHQQQQTPQRQTTQQQPHLLPRPATFARLTRNGPFCPCFSPNDSDTEPSSPVSETTTAAAASASSSSGGRNMASLARELRARFVASPGARSVQGGSGHQAVERFGMSARGRGTAGEAINVVAEPYPVQVHTQVEYTHYLVPDLLEITRAPYYWGVMDRFVAERLLENQPEGTFLLRDSAQSEYLFSVSFRRYNRTLHARIEQLNHKFSFDSFDQGVFSADTVTALIEHYKDPTTFLFFEPQLSLPLPRNFVFPLQHLCRSVIASRINYNDINQLELPKKFKDYLREYHYRHPVRVTKLE